MELDWTRSGSFTKLSRWPVFDYFFSSTVNSIASKDSVSKSSIISKMLEILSMRSLFLFLRVFSLKSSNSTESSRSSGASIASLMIFSI